MSILVKNATVIAMDAAYAAEPWQADILIEGDHIAAIGPGLTIASSCPARSSSNRRAYDE